MIGIFDAAGYFVEAVSGFVPVNEAVQSAFIPDAMRDQLSRLRLINGVVTVQAKSIEQHRADKKRALADACKAAINAGVTVGDYRYPTTPQDQANLHALVTKAERGGALQEFKFWCADANNVWARRSHTPVQILAIGDAVMLHVQEAQSIYEQRLQAVDAAQTVAAVEAVSW